MRKIVILLQAIVTAALLLYAVRKVGLQNIRQSLGDASVIILITAGSLLLMQFPLAAWRWQRIVRFMGGKVRLKASIRMVWAGAFFSQVLPSAIGGDAIRMWMAWRYGVPPSIAAASVTFDRIVLFLALTVLVLASSPWLSEWANVEFTLWSAVLLLVVGIFFVTLFIARAVFLRRTQARLVKLLATIVSDLRTAVRNPAFVLSLLSISLVSIANLVLVAWLCCLAFNIEISLWTCFLVFPAVFLFSSLPISIGGWGVRESLVVVLLSANGAPPALALTASLAFGVLGALISLPGVFGISFHRKSSSMPTP